MCTIKEIYGKSYNYLGTAVGAVSNRTIGVNLVGISMFLV